MSSSSDDLYLALECQNCSYVGEADTPIDLHDLIRQAIEHKGMCTGGTQ